MACITVLPTSVVAVHVAQQSSLRSAAHWTPQPKQAVAARAAWMRLRPAVFAR